MALTTHWPVNPLSSNKSSTLDYAFEGRRRGLYIGDFPDWSTNATREHTEDLIAFAALHESESSTLQKYRYVRCTIYSRPGLPHEIHRPSSLRQSRYRRAQTDGAGGWLAVMTNRPLTSGPDFRNPGLGIL